MSGNVNISGNFIRKFEKYIGRINNNKKTKTKKKEEQMDYRNNVPPSSDTEGVRIKLAETEKCSAFLLIV